MNLIKELYMTAIVNILATSNIEEDFTRQPIEFYLTHKVLEHPEVYKRAKKGNSYKILDCSACELHTGLDMKKVLEAAKIIKAITIKIILYLLKRSFTLGIYILLYLLLFLIIISYFYNFCI